MYIDLTSEFIRPQSIHVTEEVNNYSTMNFIRGFNYGVSNYIVYIYVELTSFKFFNSNDILLSFEQQMLNFSFTLNII